MIVKEMTWLENIAVLSASRLGRLACAKDGVPYVVPVHFAFGSGHLYSFSMPGQKIDWMRANPHICVQIDEALGHREWKSVVVNGLYEELPDTAQWRHERDHAWSLLQKHIDWWEPGGLKPNPQPVTDASPHLFYRISIQSMTGRQAFDNNASLSL